MTAGSYAERDAVRQIPMVSADGGLTWYPKDGDPADAISLERCNKRVIRLASSDGGLTWTPKE